MKTYLLHEPEAVEPQNVQQRRRIALSRLNGRRVPLRSFRIGCAVRMLCLDATFQINPWFTDCERSLRSRADEALTRNLEPAW